MRLSSILKVTIIVALVAAFDRLFPNSVAGARIGLFAIATLLAVAIGRRDVRRDRRAWIALRAATLFALLLADDPGPLPIAPFWCALARAALLPKTARFDNAWHWAVRLALHAAAGLAEPATDLKRIGPPSSRYAHQPPRDRGNAEAAAGRRHAVPGVVRSRQSTDRAGGGGGPAPHLLADADVVDRRVAPVAGATSLLHSHPPRRLAGRSGADASRHLASLGADRIGAFNAMFAVQNG